MKKLGCLLIAWIMLLCCGCGERIFEPETRLFDNTDEFRDYLHQDVWACKEELEGGWVRYKVLAFVEDYALVFRLNQDPGESVANMFVRMLTYAYSDSNVPCEELMEFLVLKPNVPGYDVESYAITYDCQNGVFSSGDESWQAHSDGTIIQDQYTYRVGDYTELWNQFFIALSDVSSGRKDAFLSQYLDAAMARDVKYDPYGYTGKLFQVTGTVALDDYFNYDYANRESWMFCICMEPNGGNYSDRWYVYADRTAFAELFQTLKSGSQKNVILICKAEFPNSIKNGLVRLVDYYIP